MTTTLRSALFILTLSFFGVANAAAQTSDTISGQYYNWKKTMKPEKPWLHDYSQTLTMKLFLCSASATEDSEQVYLTFEGALDIIKKLDAVTLGIPKIVYLVGWQFKGHDTGYPAWDQVNEALKRKKDKTGLKSLKWLMKQGEKYHTTVSLHINMIDAYTTSPLWETYLKHDIIIKDTTGQPIKGAVWAGRTSYNISYKKEWETGFAQKRIDALLKMLPGLKKSGTIHIDAFHSILPTSKNGNISDPFLHYTINDEIKAQRKIYRYWRSKGIDLTSEFDVPYRKDPFIGLQPFAWNFNARDFFDSNWLGKPADFKGLPPQLYCGTPMQLESIIKEDKNNFPLVIERFCEDVVPWYYKNNVLPKSGSFDAANGNVFIPALWLNNTIVAYSQDGYNSRSWMLPKNWGDCKEATVETITINGPTNRLIIPVTSGQIILSLAKGQEVVIKKD